MIALRSARTVSMTRTGFRCGPWMVWKPLSEPGLLACGSGLAAWLRGDLAEPFSWPGEATGLADVAP
jgi:hypothetical protein